MQKPINHILLIHFFLISHVAFSQTIPVRIIDDKWSGGNIDFPIKTSFYDTSISYKSINGANFGAFFPLDFNSPKQDVIKTKDSLESGSIEAAVLQGYGFTQYYHRICFKKKMSFITVKFSQETNFNLSKFDSGANFFGSYFFKPLVFRSSEILDEISFKGAHFINGTDFSATEFNEKADFTFAQFYKANLFSVFPIQLASTEVILKTKTFFGPYTDAMGSNPAIFKKGADFRGATFFDGVFFYKAHFKEYLGFNEANFKGTINFDQAVFPTHVSFVSAQLPEVISFRNVLLDSLKEDIDFHKASVDSLRARTHQSDKRCKIFLDNTDVSKIILDASKFELAFDSSMRYEEIINIYEQVIKKCSLMGMEETAKVFSIELQRIKIWHRHPRMGGVYIWLNKYWWNFGYEKEKIFRNILYAFLFSSILFFLFLRAFAKTYFPHQVNMSLNSVEKLGWKNKKDVLTRLKVSLFYTSLIFFGLRMEHTEVKYREHPFKTIIVYLIFVVGIIHLAYLASFVLSK